MLPWGKEISLLHLNLKKQKQKQIKMLVEPLAHYVTLSLSGNEKGIMQKTKKVQNLDPTQSESQGSRIWYLVSRVQNLVSSV